MCVCVLIVGSSGLTVPEQKAQFALWALLKSPLLIGCQITQLSQTTLDILLSEEIIAINQVREGERASECVCVCEIVTHFIVLFRIHLAFLAISFVMKDPNRYDRIYTNKEFKRECVCVNDHKSSDLGWPFEQRIACCDSV